MKIRLRIKRFIGLSIRQKLLLITVVFLSLYSYLKFLFFKHSAKFGRIDEPPKKHTSIDMNLVKDMRLAIKIISKYTPWENVCRHQAYQAMILCRLYQIPYQIFVGFKKSNEGKIEGHAWTVVNEEIITGFCKPEEYVVQSIFS